MKNYCLVLVFSTTMSQVLMLLRNKAPYQGLLNAIGGKVEPGETPVEAASRELQEETGITAKDRYALIDMLTITFPSNIVLHVFYTKLSVFELSFVYDHVMEMPEGSLHWLPTNNLMNVNDYSLAGDGNIPYFIKLAKTMEGQI